MKKASPAATAQAEETPAEATFSLSDGLVRLSVGLEDAQDLKTDVLQALQRSINSPLESPEPAIE